MTNKFIFILSVVLLLFSCSKEEIDVETKLFKFSGVYLNKSEILSDSIYEEGLPNGDGEIYINIKLTRDRFNEVFENINNLRRFPIKEKLIDKFYSLNIDTSNQLHYKLLHDTIKEKNKYSLLILDSNECVVHYFYSEY